jgi:7-cyano-7-deazaguanine synthase
MKNTLVTQVKKRIAVVSLSGGMDSTCLLLHLLANGYEVYAVSFDYGQKHRYELGMVQRNMEYLASNNIFVDWRLLPMHYIGQMFESALLQGGEIPEGHYAEENMKQTVVPNRNAIFSSIIYGYALSIAERAKKGDIHAFENVKICLGVHAGDHAIYPDCRPEFYDKLYGAFAEGNWGAEAVQLYLPYLYKDKSYILRDGFASCIDLEIDFETVLGNTNTCYNPGVDGKSCGKCGSCVERVEAFMAIGKKDPVPYALGWEETCKHVKEILSKNV